MTPDLWKSIAIQVPVVVLFVAFVLTIFKQFLKEMARRDVILTETIDKLLIDVATREQKRNQIYSESVKVISSEHGKGLIAVSKEFKALRLKVEEAIK